MQYKTAIFIMLLCTVILCSGCSGKTNEIIGEENVSTSIAATESKSTTEKSIETEADTSESNVTETLSTSTTVEISETENSVTTTTVSETVSAETTAVSENTTERSNITVVTEEQTEQIQNANEENHSALQQEQVQPVEIAGEIEFEPDTPREDSETPIIFNEENDISESNITEDTAESTEQPTQEEINEDTPSIVTERAVEFPFIPAR